MPGIEAGSYCSACGFDCFDSRTGGAGDDDVNRLRESGDSAPREKFDSILDAVDTAGFSQFADGDWFGRVDAALVNPFLDAVEVYGRDVEGEALGGLDEHPSLRNR